MKRMLKWMTIIGGCLIVAIITALLLIPRFVDVKKYKPQIEQRVADATGRTFSVGDDLRLSLFPWAGVSFSDLKLGSLPGFDEKDFVTVNSFEVRVKLFPLLFKDVQVKHFLLKGARIVLEKSKDGRANWIFSQKSPGAIKSEIPPANKSGERPPPEKSKSSANNSEKGLQLESIVVGDFAVTKGSVLWIDHVKDQRRELSDVNFKLQDFSLERPFKLFFAARLDDMPLSLQGSLGPLGKDLGKGEVPFDVTFKALEQLEAALKGRIIDPVAKPQFQLDVLVSSFSPRKLLAALGQPFPVKTSDPKALNSVSFKARVEGDNQRISVSDGVVDFDASKLKLFVSVKEFSKPNVTFDVDLDKIDLDQYLPPPGEKKPLKDVSKVKTSGSDPGAKATESAPKDKTSKSASQVKAAKTDKKKVDYAPLRRLVLNGAVKIGKLKIKNAGMEDVRLNITGKNGIFNLAPFSMALYQGGVAGKASLNVKKNTPKTKFNIDAKGIQAGPLLNDVLKKDFLEGTLKAKINMALAGDTPEAIKNTISGNGDLLFRDGAVKGIDLAGMVRNIKATFGPIEQGTEKPKTDFAEFHVPFTIKRGLTETSNTRLLSPLLRVSAAGKADLVTETLDFRVEPKFVGTIKGQGDTKERSGIMIPVLVSGSFASPKFSADLEGLIRKRIEKELPKLQERLLGGDKQKGESKSLEEQLKGFFKGLPFGK
jgi:AsmA protein